VKTAVTILGLTLCLLTARLKAADAPPKPGPEIKKFEIFAGKWKLDEVDEASPFGPAGTSTLHTEIRFIHNGFFMEENGKGKDQSNNPYSYTILYYYDSAAKTYRSFYYTSDGTAVQMVGNLEGNTWSYQWTQQDKGKNYHCKGVSTAAPDRKTFTYEWSYSEDSVTWKRMFRGTATKVGK
jgi:hypothetical protein